MEKETNKEQKKKDDKRHEECMTQESGKKWDGWRNRMTVYSFFLSFSLPVSVLMGRL